jgi:hypothetical protein
VPKTERSLFQVRITDEEKRRIKTLAASQGVTLQKALTEAFAAWEREVKASGAKGAGKKKSA